jgi:chromosome condensin MukBEF complex kleisin-like MukF subunit
MRSIERLSWELSTSPKYKPVDYPPLDELREKIVEKEIGEPHVMSDENNLVLEQLRAMRAEVAAFRAEQHFDMQQVKGRLNAVEKTIAYSATSIANQWESFDDRVARIQKLELPQNHD